MGYMIKGTDYDILAPYYVRTFPGSSILGLRSSTGKRLGNPGTALGICKGKFQRKLESRYDCLLNGFIAGAENLEDEAPIFAARLVSKTLSCSDFDMMNGWIDHCEAKHKRSCGLPNSIDLPPNFKCINVWTMQIVPVDVTEPYLALSWVWGSPPPETVKQVLPTGTFVGELPRSAQAIGDAISATRELGKLYLWVDQYCIKQEDTVAIRIQIRNIDKIYENAVSILVTAPLLSESVGLPGVSRPRSLP